MAEALSFDVVVMGAGAVGEVLAGRTAAAGLSTVIIEEDLVGGECSYWACMPSKALLRPMTVRNATLRNAAMAKSFGDIDVARVLQTRNETVNDYNDQSQVQWVEDADITLLRGRGRLDGDRRVVVTGTDGAETVVVAITAVVVATGSSAVVPPVDGLADIDPWTSRDATSARTIPARLAVIGGGVVAVEMAQAFSSLGADVTVLVRGNSLLEGHEPFVGRELADEFERNGIDVRLDTETKKVSKLDGGQIQLELSAGSAITVDQVLVATGRKPNTVDIGLATVGLLEGPPITVDDQLKAVGVDGWLYAVGDVNGRALLTHQGKYQARIASDVIAGKTARAWADNVAVPDVIFTDPQIAHVGRTFEQAKSAGLNARELKVPLTSAAGAFVEGIEHGTAQLVIDEDRKVVVGATFTGPEVAEMLQAATIAVAAEVTMDTLWHAVPAYPTVSEVWLRLLESYGL